MKAQDGKELVNGDRVSFLVENERRQTRETFHATLRSVDAQSCFAHVEETGETLFFSTGSSVTSVPRR